MKLDELQVSNLRNILSARVNFHPKINIIVGENGCGKTSFLEALHLLSSGHSFRTREISALVSHEQDALTVFAKTVDGQRVSIQKSVSNPTIARLNGQPCLTSSELASFLPCQVFYQDIFQLIDAGPSLRRGLLDWGLFHVERDYHSLWKDYRRVVKQRNSLLRSRVARQQLTPWNNKLVDFAQQLDSYRSRYLNSLASIFETIIQQLTNINCGLQYYRGWDRKNEGISLDDILNNSYDSDSLRHYTHYGAHQADLLVISKDFKVKNYLSRGQQKMVLFALKFAQALLVQTSCIFLIDDLASELDHIHINKLIDFISSIDGQFFITVRPTDFHLLKLCDSSSKVFTINNGCLD